MTMSIGSQIEQVICKHTEWQCPGKGMKREITILQSLVQLIATSNQIPDNGLKAEHQSVIDDLKLKASIQIADKNSKIAKLSAEHKSVIKDQNRKYPILE
jgi:hypothetical protein